MDRLSSRREQHEIEQRLPTLSRPSLQFVVLFSYRASQNAFTRRICHSAESEIWNVHIASNIKPSPWARATSPPENFLSFVVGRSTTAYSPGCNSEAGDTLYFPAASFSACVNTRSSRKCEYICQSAAGLVRTSALPCVAPTILQVFCAGVSFTIAGS